MNWNKFIANYFYFSLLGTISNGYWHRGIHPNKVFYEALSKILEKQLLNASMSMDTQSLEQDV